MYAWYPGTRLPRPTPYSPRAFCTGGGQTNNAVAPIPAAFSIQKAPRRAISDHIQRIQLTRVGDVPKVPTAGKPACRAAMGPPAGILDRTTGRRCPASTAEWGESASVSGEQTHPPAHPPNHTPAHPQAQLRDSRFELHHASLGKRVDVGDSRH